MMDPEASATPRPHTPGIALRHLRRPVFPRQCGAAQPEEASGV